MATITPKLTFNVGEKVVICAEETSFSGNDSWPDENDFCFTTIKEVRPDGKVVVEEGYVYRQSYKTYYGETEFHNYFRIVKVPPTDVTSYPNRREYFPKTGSINEKASFFGVTFLLKNTPEFEEKVKKAQEKCDINIEKQLRAEEIARKKKPFLDAYKKYIEPFEDALSKAQIKGWKENVCNNCVKNKNGYCQQWKQDIATSDITHCSAFKIEGEED